ncbi:MAG: hypothetical protein LCH57_01730 [Proteobacteria bacterium]|nr:hypothetical protein [Pseudomonadota bacterium]
MTAAPHPLVSDLREANNRAHDRKVRLSAALIKLVEHFERVDAPEADRRAIHSACQVWAGVKAEDICDGRSATNPYALQRAIANLRDSIADAIPFGLTYVNSDDLAVVMEAVDLASPAPVAGPAHPAVPPVAIVPDYCTGTSLAFEPGVLHVSKDGSGYIAIDEKHFELEDDRCEGPDGPEGSLHWITRMDASEVVALRDFLNGAPPAADAGPDDPTEEMIQAGLKVDFDNEDERASVINLWHVMKAAAPPAADEDRVRIAVEALGKIERWFGEFPETGRFWPDESGQATDQPMSYSACWGSNGERDYMRSVARQALAALKSEGK